MRPQANDTDAAGAEFPARIRENASTAALDTPLPRNPVPEKRDPGVDSVKITPEPCLAMCRATAFAVRKFVRVYAAIGCS